MSLLPKRMFWIALAIASVSILTFLNTVDAQIVDDNSLVENQTFLDWCLQYDELPEATQYSVQYLLENAETNDCHEAAQILETQSSLRKTSTSIQGDFRPFSSLTEVAEIDTRLAVEDSPRIDFNPLGNLPNLAVFKIHGKIHDLSPFSVLQDLEELKIISFRSSTGDPKLSNLSPLASLSNIRKLYISVPHEAINDLTPLSELFNLEELTIPAQNIYDLRPLSNLANLNYLSLERNPIQNLSPLKNLSFLTELTFSHNNVSNLSPLENLHRLSSLSFSHTQISDLAPLSHLDKLTTILALANDISNLDPLRSLYHLEVIEFSENRISDLAPLADLTQLEVIGLSKNNISDLTPLANLVQLSFLSLDGNPISDLSPLSGLTNLERLVLPNDPDLDISPLDSLIQQGNLQIRRGRCGRC